MPRSDAPGVAPRGATDTDTTRADPDARLKSLPNNVYLFRVLGMGLGALPVATVLHERQAGWPAWAWVAFACVLWPHLAYAIARRSGNPFHAERRNLLVDSMLAGSMVSVMHFNLLPSVMLLAVATADKINSGIRGLWLRALPGMLAALALAGVFTGFAWAPHTGMPVLIASLPVLVIHTIAVSLGTYRLIRKVQKQNLRLDELNRLDALTGLGSRAHWERQAEIALRQHQADDRAATLLLADVDRFKAINDRHGHATGDDVLREIANVVRRAIPEGSDAGRIGGDEYAIVLPLELAAAEAVAERIRLGVETLRFPRLPSLRCSISLGLAEPPAAGLTLREWTEAADRALYRAKDAGRNRAASREQVPGTPQPH